MPSRTVPTRGRLRPTAALATLAVLVVGVGVVAAPPAFAAAPSITSFAPTSGAMGTTVTVTGTGFVAPATVAFGGISAGAATVVSSTKLTAVVPAAAPTGKIVVKTAGGSATSTGTFTVLAGASVTPAVGPPTTVTTVALGGFRVGEAVDLTLDTTAVKLVVAGKTGAASLKLTIPATATPGDHTVTAIGRASGFAAQTVFTVRTNWARGGFDLARTGANPYENVLTAATVGRATQQWRTPVGGQVEVTPAVVNGVVYAAADNGTMAAYDAGTGARKWIRTGLGTFLYSSPVVDGSTLFFGTDSGTVYALNTATGATRWTAATGNAEYSSPVVAGGLVYLGSYDSNVYAFDEATVRPGGCSPSGTRCTALRRWWADRCTSAAWTAWCTRSTPRPGPCGGRTRWRGRSSPRRSRSTAWCTRPARARTSSR